MKTKNIKILEDSDIKRFYEHTLLAFEKPPLTLNELRKESRKIEIFYLARDKHIISGLLGFKRDKVTFHIWLIFTHNQYRRKGSASTLIKKLIRRINAKRLTVFTEPTNKAALITFLKNDFEIYGYLYKKNFLMLERKISEF